MLEQMGVESKLQVGVRYWRGGCARLSQFRPSRDTTCARALLSKACHIWNRSTIILPLNETS